MYLLFSPHVYYVMCDMYMYCWSCPIHVPIFQLVHCLDITKFLVVPVVYMEGKDVQVTGTMC